MPERGTEEACGIKTLANRRDRSAAQTLGTRGGAAQLSGGGRGEPGGGGAGRFPQVPGRSDRAVRSRTTAPAATTATPSRAPKPV